MTTALLAIWSDVPPARETDYLHWLTREHAAERVGLPGFEAVRVFRAALPGVHRYLILYDLASPAVLTSPDYLARLNAPTPWSRRIMPLLGNFARGGGALHGPGNGGGGHLLPLRLAQVPGAAEALLAALAAEDRICAARLLRVDQDGSAVPTSEKAMRGGDGSFAGLLLLEATDADALRDALARHRAAITELGAEAGNPAPYAAVFTMRKAELV
jgi:hypothetical protein